MAALKIARLADQPITHPMASVHQLERQEFRFLTRALYEVISAPAGQRDWDRIRTFYHPRACLVRTATDDEGKPQCSVMTLDEYIQDVEVKLAEACFEERELQHHCQRFGLVAQVASVYEFKLEQQGRQTGGRGVNFLTLVFAKNRWQVMSIVWDNERAGQRLPQSLFSHPNP